MSRRSFNKLELFEEVRREYEFGVATIPMGAANILIFGIFTPLHAMFIGTW